MYRNFRKLIGFILSLNRLSVPMSVLVRRLFQRPTTLSARNTFWHLYYDLHRFCTGAF